MKLSYSQKKIIKAFELMASRLSSKIASAWKREMHLMQKRNAHCYGLCNSTNDYFAASNSVCLFLIQVLQLLSTCMRTSADHILQIYNFKCGYMNQKYALHLHN